MLLSKAELAREPVVVHTIPIKFCKARSISYDAVSLLSDL
jgi:hypothetical protein